MFENICNDRQTDGQTTTPISEAIARSVPPGKNISDYLPCTGKVQQKLSSVTASSNTQYLLENAPTARDAARLRSTTGKGARAWLNAIPTSQVFALNSCDFRLASFLRLGLPIASPAGQRHAIVEL